MMKIGIAITTYNRVDYLKEQIKLIQKFSLGNYEIVVCDDGSSDNTIEYLNSENIPYISGKNRGVAWNKNRGLYYLVNYTSSDVFLLLDDDIRPGMYGWDIEWLHGAQLHGHINFIASYVMRHAIFGRCTASSPGLCPLLQGAAIATSREVFHFVGYFDSRFGRYGHEHTEYTNRFIKAGFGGVVRNDKTTLYAAMNSGLELLDLPSNGSLEEAKKNEYLLSLLGEEPLFRQPWQNEQEKQEFLSEFIKMKQTISIPEWEILKDFDKDFYLKTYPDIRGSGFDPVTHYYLYGQYENRKRKAD